MPTHQQPGPLHLLRRHGMTGGDAASVRHAAEAYEANTPTEHMLCVLARIAVHTHSLLEELMDRTAELETQLTNLQTAVGEATTRVANDLGSLHAELQSLQTATPPEVDLSGVLTHVAAIKQQVDSIDSQNPPPPDDSPAEEGAESPEQEAAEEPGGEEPAAAAPAGDVPGDPTQAAPQDPGAPPPDAGGSAPPA